MKYVRTNSMKILDNDVDMLFLRWDRKNNAFLDAFYYAT